jgi:hypothetical protein
MGELVAFGNPNGSLQWLFQQLAWKTHSDRLGQISPLVISSTVLKEFPMEQATNDAKLDEAHRWDPSLLPEKALNLLFQCLSKIH